MLRNGLSALLLILLTAGPVAADATHEQGKCGQAGDVTNISLTYENSVPVGQLMWVGAGWNLATDDTVTITVTDSGGHTWTHGSQAVNPGDVGAIGAFAIATSVGAHQVTATITNHAATPTAMMLCIAAAAGNADASPLDDADGAQADDVGAVAGLDVGTLTTTTTAGIAYTFIATNGGRTFIAPTNYTMAATQTARVAAAYRVTGSPGSYGATWTWTSQTSDVAGIHMAFKSDVSGPTGAGSLLLRLE